MRTPSSQLSAEQLEQLELARQPFDPPEDNDGIYRNTALDMLTNTIVQQLQSGERIHIITGERDIGKTTFCLRLEHDAPEPLTVNRFTATRKSRINDVFLTLIDSVADIEGTDTHALATAAAQAVFRRLRSGEQPVLLIDDAHTLSTAVLRMIMRFHQSIERQGLGQLKLVLLTEKQIERKLAELDAAAPDDARLQTHLLRPLNRTEIDDYLLFRFEQAGGTQPPLTSRNIHYIRDNAGGLPGKVDTLAARLLSGESVPSPQRRRAWIAVIVAGVIAGVLSGTFLTGRNAPDPETSESTPEVAGRTDPPAEPDGGTAGTNAEIPDPGAGQPQRQPDPATSPAPGPDVTATAADPVTAASPTAETAPANETVSTGPADEDDAASTEPDVTAQADATKTGAAEPAQTQLQPPPASIARWPADHYVIQLAGAWTPDRLNAMVDEYADYDFLVHRVDRNDRTWYILLYGSFPDRDTAEKAIAALPEELQRNRPWSRPIEGLLNP